MKKTTAEPTRRLLAPLLLAAFLAAFLAACGAANGVGEPAEGAGSAPAGTDPAAASRDAAAGGPEDEASPPPGMPPLSVDRGAEPAPALQPPLGEIVELRGVVESWPQPAGARVRAAVEIAIADGFHVNSNPPAEDWIIPTEVRLEETPGVGLAAVHYPPAQAVTFDFWPEPLDVWQGAPVVGLELQVADDAAPGERTARIVVRYQACNDDACFRPMEATLRLALEIAGAGAATEPLESPLLTRAPFPEGPAGD